jgi:hypothetical protein
MIEWLKDSDAMYHPNLNVNDWDSATEDEIVHHYNLCIHS